MQHTGGFVLQGVMVWGPRCARDGVCRESPPYKSHWQHLALNNPRSFPFSKSVLVCLCLGQSLVVLPLFGRASPVCVALLGYCTALNSSYVNEGAEDGAPFIPQTLLIRKKPRILNENCVVWLAQEAE